MTFDHNALSKDMNNIDGIPLADFKPLSVPLSTSGFIHLDDLTPLPEHDLDGLPLEEATSSSYYGLDGLPYHDHELHVTSVDTYMPAIVPPHSTVNSEQRVADYIHQARLQSDSIQDRVSNSVSMIVDSSSINIVDTPSINPPDSGNHKPSVIISPGLPSYSSNIIQGNSGEYSREHSVSMPIASVVQNPSVATQSVSPPVSSFSCYQLNCHRSLGPLDNLQNIIATSSHSSHHICFIQEPPVNRENSISGVCTNLSVFRDDLCHDRPRSALLLTPYLAGFTTPLTGFSSRDLSAARLSLPSHKKDILICSFYWDCTLPDIPEALNLLCEYAQSHNLPLILGGDANAHHTAWGSSGTNKRGSLLMDFILRHNLTYLNDGSKTFRNAIREEVLDLTLVNPLAYDIVSCWHTPSIPSLSDHSLIKFEVNLQVTHTKPNSSSLQPSRKLKVLNSSLYIEKVEELITAHAKPLSLPCDTIDKLNDRVDLIHSIIHKAASHSNMTYFVSNKSLQKRLKSPWWNKELRIHRSSARRCWNRWKRSGSLTDLAAYKKANNRYLKLIKQSKTRGWQAFCSKASMSHSSTASLVRKLNSKHVPLTSIKKGDGSYTQSALETLSEITSKDHMSSLPIPPVPPLHLDIGAHTVESARDIATSICTEVRVNKAFSLLDKKKASGPDGITNDLLIHAWPLIKPYIVDIFISSLSLGYIPFTWQTSTGIFVHKPAKLNYHLIKNWRIISLCSSLLKLLERIVSLYLNDSVNIDIILSDDQLGFRKSRSTDEAIHCLISKIEEALVNGQFALSCFVDIKSAFDSISFQSIILALSNAGISTHIINWIISLLGNRKTLFSLKGSSLLKYMVKGTPQGGILSPLLWNLVINSLLTTLRDMIGERDLSQGYADDVVTVVIGHDLPALIGQMQNIVDVIDQWCKLNGLELCNDKTTLVLFTWKRKFTINTPILLNGLPISYSPDARYLGLIIDEKLNWSKHVGHVSSKATKSLIAANRGIGKTGVYQQVHQSGYIVL